jgi:hypothetical protein
MLPLPGIKVSDLRLPKVVVKSEEDHFVLAEVYSPLHVDTDGEAMTAEEIRKMAYRFLSEGKVRKIDVQHNQQESGCVMVESFIARDNDPDGFIKDSWVAGLVIPSGEVWDKVKKGELNGFSFLGEVRKIPVQAKVTVTRKMVGETEDSIEGLLPAHSHPVTITFSENGRVEPGWTDEAFSHRHPVQRATATEPELEHGHRIILVEN